MTDIDALVKDLLVRKPQTKRYAMSVSTHWLQCASEDWKGDVDPNDKRIVMLCQQELSDLACVLS